MSAPTPLSIFREEVRELLSGLDSALLDLNPDAPDREAVHDIFRRLHTLKGSCDMFGHANSVAMLHEMESLWDLVRSGDDRPVRELVSLTFALKDALSPLADHGEDPLRDTELLRAMAALSTRTLPTPGPAEERRPEREQGQREDSGGASGSVHSYAVTYAPSDRGHLDKLEPASIIDSLLELGEATVRVDPAAVPCLEDLDVRDCHLKWSIDLASERDIDAVRDVFLFLDNPGDSVVTEEAGPPHAQEIPDAPAPRHPETPSSPPPGGREPGPAQAAAHAPPETPGEPTHRDTPPAAAAPAASPSFPAAGQPKVRAASQSVRVETAKLDNLVNLVGELVIAQARLTQIASVHPSQDLAGVAEEIERLAVELRDNTLGIRMLPIGTTFSRFRRLVRDLSAELGKEIELTAEGGETELDKTVIEQLADPLVHLLRNSIDHGIEPPGEREARGKPRAGLIRLTARQASGRVEIRIEDDGKGLDPARIKSKAVERGIIPADARLSSQDIFQLVFSPGFSTAEKVTNISGRGVGMDVVKSAIEGLRGTVSLDSAPEAGTTVLIQLPLTLAIIDGLQVRVGQDLYVIPLAQVEECVELAGSGGEGRGRTLCVRGDIVPYLRLRETFHMAGERPGLEQVVVTRHENGRTGIAVDEVIGQQQTVIKTLGRVFGHVEGISGATINGDGTMALILDVPQLVASLRREEPSWEAH